MNQWVSGIRQQAVQGRDPWAKENKRGESYNYNSLFTWREFPDSSTGKGDTNRDWQSC